MSKSYLPVLLLLLLSPVFLFGQTNEGEIRMEKTFFGVKFYENDRLLRPKQVLDIMKVNDQAFTAFKKAKSNYDAGQALGFVGGFMIGWPLGTIGGGEPEWGLAAGGVGVLLLTIPLNSAFSKHARSAIDIYNGGTATATSRGIRIQLVPCATGARLTMRL